MAKLSSWRPRCFILPPLLVWAILQDLLKGLGGGVFCLFSFFFLGDGGDGDGDDRVGCGGVCSFQLPYKPPSIPMSVILCLCLLELFVTATKLLISNTWNKHGIRNESNVLVRAVRVRWLMKNMTAAGCRPRAEDLKVCVHLHPPADPWKEGNLASFMIQGGMVLGWQFQ